MNRIRLLCMGYYVVTLSDGNYGRFINICKNHAVKIYYVKHREQSCGFMVGCEDIEIIERLAQKGICKVNISGCCGITGIIKKYKDRVMFFAGGIMFAIMLYAMQLFMWDIVFDGNILCRDENILDTLQENGVHKGMPMKDISCDEIEKILRREYNSLTWISAEIHGTQLILHIKENEDAKENNTEPEGNYDIVAAYDGVIRDMVTISGTPEVIPDTKVVKGDVLVRGQLDIYNDNLEIEAVHEVMPKAYIMGEYYYTYDEYMEDFSVNESSKAFLMDKYYHFLFKIKEKGIQIIEKNVKIEKVDHGYRIYGKIKAYGELGIKRKVIREDIIQDERN